MSSGGRDPPVHKPVKNTPPSKEHAREMRIIQTCREVLQLLGTANESNDADIINKSINMLLQADDPRRPDRDYVAESHSPAEHEEKIVKINNAIRILTTVAGSAIGSRERGTEHSARQMPPELPSGTFEARETGREEGPLWEPTPNVEETIIEAVNVLRGMRADPAATRLASLRPASERLQRQGADVQRALELNELAQQADEEDPWETRYGGAAGGGRARRNPPRYQGYRGDEDSDGWWRQGRRTIFIF